MIAASLATAPDGGIGCNGSVMRSMATSTTTLALSLRAGATRSSYVTIGIGAPLEGGRPWHVVQWLASTPATSHGTPVTTVVIDDMPPPAPAAPPSPAVAGSMPV